MSSCCPSLSSTQDRYSSGIRRRSSGSIPSLDMCQVSIAMPPFVRARAGDDLEHGVDAPDVHVEGHELVDDLRVRVLGRLVAELAEALGELRELGRACRGCCRP